MGAPWDIRGMVADLAEKDAAKATALAYTIKDPWYRCQSLAYAASSIQDRKRQKAVLDDAFEAALAANGPNRVVTVSAWPLSVLVDIKNFDRLDSELDRLLWLVTTEPHPTRRCDAVFCLLNRAQQAPAVLVAKMADALISHCLAGHGWRRDRNLRDAAAILKHVGLDNDAIRCVKIIENARVRRQAQRIVDQ